MTVGQLRNILQNYEPGMVVQPVIFGNTWYDNEYFDLDLVQSNMDQTELHLVLRKQD
jgi:hypothetical protein